MQHKLVKKYNFGRGKPPLLEDTKTFDIALQARP